jgi:hypothetical protein
MLNRLLFKGLLLSAAFMLPTHAKDDWEACSFSSKETSAENRMKNLDAAIVVCGDKFANEFRPLFRISIFTWNEKKGNEKKDCAPTEKQMKQALNYCQKMAGPEAVLSEPMTYAKSSENYNLSLLKREEQYGKHDIFVNASIDYDSRLIFFKAQHNRESADTYAKLPLFNGLTKAEVGLINLAAFPVIASAMATPLAGTFTTAGKALIKAGINVFGKKAAQAAASEALETALTEGAKAAASEVLETALTEGTKTTLKEIAKTTVTEGAKAAASEVLETAVTETAKRSSLAMIKKIFSSITGFIEDHQVLLGVFFNTVSAIMQKAGEAYFKAKICDFESGAVIRNPLEQSAEAAFYLCRWRKDASIHSVLSLFPTTNHGKLHSLSEVFGVPSKGCRPTDEQLEVAAKYCLDVAKDDQGKSQTYFSFFPITINQIRFFYEKELTTRDEDPQESGGEFGFFKEEKAHVSISNENPNQIRGFLPVSIPAETEALLKMQAELIGPDTLDKEQSQDTKSTKNATDEEDPFKNDKTYRHRSEVGIGSWQACDFPTKKVQLKQGDASVRPAFVGCLDKNNKPLFKMSIFTWASKKSPCKPTEDQLDAARKHCEFAGGKDLTAVLTEKGLDKKYPIFARMSSLKSNIIRGASVDYDSNIVFFLRKHDGYLNEIYKKNLYKYGLNLNKYVEETGLFIWTLASNVVGLLDNITQIPQFVAQAVQQGVQSFQTAAIPGQKVTQGFEWKDLFSSDLGWAAHICDFDTGKTLKDLKDEAQANNQKTIPILRAVFYACMDTETSSLVWIKSVFPRRKSTQQCTIDEKAYDLLRASCLSDENRWFNPLGQTLNVVLEMYPELHTSTPKGETVWNKEKTKGTILYNKDEELVEDKLFIPLVLDDNKRAAHAARVASP